MIAWDYETLSDFIVALAALVCGIGLIVTHRRSPR